MLRVFGSIVFLFQVKGFKRVDDDNSPLALQSQKEKLSQPKSTRIIDSVRMVRMYVWVSNCDIWCFFQNYF